MNYPTTKLSENFFATLNGRVADFQSARTDVIRLDIGSPDLPPAPHIVAALAQSAENPDHHGYQSHRGPEALRSAWSEMYRRVHGIEIQPDEVLPLMGSKEGVFHLSLALLNPGDMVLVPDPGYQTYTQGARFAGAESIPLTLLPENGYLPDLSAIPARILQRTKILWLNYPNNPTAALATKDFFSEVVDFAHQNNILICHDAAYTQVVFDGIYAPSILDIPGAAEVAVEFNTLSKSHNMAGWRVGAAVGNPAALAALLKLKTHADSGHFRPVLDAAVAAMVGSQSWLDERNAIYQERRDMVVQSLREMGLHPQVPQASLYIWCPLPEGWDSATQFVLTLLEQAHITLAPGTIFGASGEGFIRISLVQPIARMLEAMDRMQKVLVPESSRF